MRIILFHAREREKCFYISSIPMCLYSSKTNERIILLQPKEVNSICIGMCVRYIVSLRVFCSSACA
jgi:hypothetical protein